VNTRAPTHTPRREGTGLVPFYSACNLQGYSKDCCPVVGLHYLHGRKGPDQQGENLGGGTRRSSQHGRTATKNDIEVEQYKTLL
jgi:hypothetical protein